MAESGNDMKRRVERLEGDVIDLKQVSIQLANLAVDQSERLDGLNERVDGLTQRVDGLCERVDGLCERVDGTNERLDRLIAVTMRERTAGAERLLRIEDRLDKLEERVGRD